MIWGESSKFVPCSKRQPINQLLSKNRWISRKVSLLLGSVFYHSFRCSGASLIHTDAIPCRILMHEILPNLTEGEGS